MKSLPERFSTEFFISVISFIILLILGSAIYSDYGVSWDEKAHLDYSFEVLNKFFSEGTALPRDERLYYGRFFDIMSYLIIRSLSLTNSRSILLAKHFLTFIYFCNRF